jgi:hypothetical protein
MNKHTGVFVTVMNRWILLFVVACFSQAANAVLKIDITEIRISPKLSVQILPAAENFHR